MVDIKHNVTQKTVQVSARMFSNDLEDALSKLQSKKIDVLNPKNKAEVDSILYRYIKKRLQISINTKLQSLNYIGYEREDESIWTYLEIKKIVSPTKITINTKLLYDFLPEQTNIVHIQVKELKKSGKVTNPDSKLEFSF